jgi:hypothetical protein
MRRQVPPAMGRVQAKAEIPSTRRARATLVARAAMGRARGRWETLPGMRRAGVELRNDGQGNAGRSMGSGLPPTLAHERPAVFLERPPPQAPWASIQSPDHGGPIRLPLRSALDRPVELPVDQVGPRPKIEG